MSTTLKVYANCSDVFLVWQIAAKIQNCLGFAVQRKIDGIDDVLTSSVGFGETKKGANEPSVNPGAFRPTTNWPLQRFTWTDFTITAGRTVQYRVVPMIGTESNLQPDHANGSLWSDPVTLDGDSKNTAFSAYFNDGVVATQWLARELQSQPSMSNSIKNDISVKGNPIRMHLGGAVLRKLLSVLNEAHAAGATLYAALFELNDVELIPLLESFGSRANVVLANGSVKGNGDENGKARAQLRSAGVNVKDRLLKNPHLGHNKFLVICNGTGAPQKVWTGSTNWTETGLCTQANNALLISNPTIAGFYKQQWDVLAAAASAFPPTPVENTLRRTFPLGTSSATVSFTPWKGTAGTITPSQPADLAYAKQLIAQAKNGILFLQFMPGPRGTLLEAINDRNTEPNLYVRGVVNQDPGTQKHPVVGLFHQGESIPATFDVLIPEAIDKQISFWDKELRAIVGAHAIVHSKVIVLDPFGVKPVVMTGSHNMGTKASLANDENLVIIEGNPELARQYAVNVITVFNQYWWRYNRMKPSDRTPKHVAATRGDSADFQKMLEDRRPKRVWSGLRNTDAWQDQYFTGSRLVEFAFWLGDDALRSVATRVPSRSDVPEPASASPADGTRRKAKPRASKTRNTRATRRKKRATSPRKSRR